MLRSDPVNGHLRSLVGSAERWRQVGDLHPYVGVFRDFGMSVLSQLIENLPQYERFREWIPQNWRDKAWAGSRYDSTGD